MYTRIRLQDYEKMKLPERSLLLTRGIFAIASFSLVGFFIGPMEGFLIFLVSTSILVSFLRRSEIFEEA